MGGLGSILPLPQLVVCSNQSSGKSSVLEAITEVPFPRKENLCTRFATEIILRRDQSETIQTKIIPDESRPEHEKNKLKAFQESISDFEELPTLIEKATILMGLDAAPGWGGDAVPRAFSRDVLSVEITGPSRPQLTLVDLPGLIQSANEMQSDADIDLIHSLVSDYLDEPRTIMLAVISAKDDHANQAILAKCRKVDPDGHRTLGIVTKPDYLRAGSANQENWITLAKNKDIYFELGGHMLKNRGEDEGADSFAKRNAAETEFFNQGKSREIPASDKCISSLRTKLAKLLFRHLKKEIPNLQADLNAKHAATIAQLEALGEKRGTTSKQKRFLMNIASSYQNVVTSAVDGHYEHAFFGPIQPDKLFEDISNMKHLRAAIQHLNLQFASQMRQYGHKFRIWAGDDAAGTNSKKDLPEPELMEPYDEAKSLQKVLKRQDAVQWVKDILVRTRGRELPGNFNPLLMSQLFWEQSEHWNLLAAKHIDQVSDLCSAFVRAAIESAPFPDVAARLLALKINEALDVRRQHAILELHKLIEDKQRPPITYDPSYTANIQESRSRKTAAKFEKMMREASVTTEDGNTMLNPEIMKNQMKELENPDMDQVSAEDALDSQLAYYEDRVKYFIAAVTDQVIERNLLHNLATDTFSPLVVNDMADGEIGYVAAEADEVTHKRDFLEGHKAILETGQKAFREAVGSYK
ncbi:Interferon-induced GTP-binding protein Mx1 [Fulvia fulva]|nr:Interferon-induced GTP-binding protein Mx1 [Fulvia fulva]KAK4610939.1 Interferon-induced GTP-binding protein Mx1 [Fulvia fulva]WPV22018.1 Interferon-induced GTP-binding protein Mx1 [Fulvia fulva]